MKGRKSLPEVATRLNSKSLSTSEILFYGGMRRDTEVRRALALDVRRRPLDRPYLSALPADMRNGPEVMTGILKSRLERTAALCGIGDLSRVSPKTVRAA